MTSTDEVLERGTMAFGPDLVIHWSSVRDDAAPEGRAYRYGPVEKTGPGFTIESYRVVLEWGEPGYNIKLSRLDTESKVLAWVRHLAKKPWPEMTPSRIAQLIDALAAHGGWPTYRL